MAKQITVIRNYMRSDEIVSLFAEAVGKANASPYISSALLAVASNPALLECTPQSIASSAMQAATLKLSCDPGTGQAWMVPYNSKEGKKATFQIGYRGYYAMAMRTNKYVRINLSKVVEGQTVVEDQRTGDIVIEGPYKRDADPIGYMLYFRMTNGFEKTFYMSIEEIEAHKTRYAKGFNRTDSAWKTSYEAMCKKTVMRIGLKSYGYFDPHDMLLLKESNDDEDVIDAEVEELPEVTEEMEHSEFEGKSVNEMVSLLGYDDDDEPEKPETVIDPETGEVIQMEMLK